MEKVVSRDQARACWQLATAPALVLEAPKPATRDLQLEGDAERIETGWWDSNDVRRDYFVAKDRRGTCYWVFRDRGKQGSLFIHGIFA